MTEDERLRQKYIRVLPHLNERQRRLVSAADAQLLGYGGIAQQFWASEKVEEPRGIKVGSYCA